MPCEIVTRYLCRRSAGVMDVCKKLKIHRNTPDEKLCSLVLLSYRTMNMYCSNLNRHITMFMYLQLKYLVLIVPTKKTVEIKTYISVAQMLQ